MKKRAEAIADLATRLLHNELTADDVAMVLTSYFKSQGMDVEVSADNVKATVTAQTELDHSIEEFADALGELFETLASAGKHYDNNKEKPRKDTADNTIDQFLKSIGVR